jgi:membrane protease YdiL (CAAX protease family)
LPTNWPRESWNPILAILCLFAVVVILFVAQTGYVVYGLRVTHAFNFQQVQANSLPPTQMLLLQFVSFTPIALFLLLVLPSLAKRPLSQLGFRMPTSRDLIVAAAGAIAMAIAVDGSGSVFAAALHRHDSEAAVVLLKSLRTPYEQTLFFVLACIFAPFCEELLFRVFIFNALTRYVPIAVAALVSGVLFGLLHLSGGGLAIVTVALPLMLGGIILAYVYAETKSFWACVTTHALFNSISVASFFFLHAS